MDQPTEQGTEIDILELGVCEYDRKLLLDLFSHAGGETYLCCWNRQPTCSSVFLVTDLAFVVGALSMHAAKGARC